MRAPTEVPVDERASQEGWKRAMPEQHEAARSAAMTAHVDQIVPEIVT